MMNILFYLFEYLLVIISSIIFTMVYLEMIESETLKNILQNQNLRAPFLIILFLITVMCMLYIFTLLW